MSSKNNTPTNAMGNNKNNNIRKYLVLLHDCLAIKFTSIITSSSSSPSSELPLETDPRGASSSTRDSRAKPIAQNSQNKSSTSTIQSGRRTTASTASAPVRGPPDQHCNQVNDDDDGDDNHYEEEYDNKGNSSKSLINKRKQASSTSTSSRQVDQSLKGLLLYKEFRDINLSCFWNAALQQSFEKLEYKGTVVPSTILVGSPIRRHLTILKTAFSRKMLKCPEGFQIEFVGEIEELIADPIEKSHFIPLSDSLCWAIHELTSSGQEAFVDEILMELSSAFPETVLPPKELIYQVLERLTKERKVYQTSQGYFLVTPDTQRYILSTDPSFMFSHANPYNSTPNPYHFIVDSSNGFDKGRVGTLDSLKSRPPAIPEIPDDDDDDLDGIPSILDHYEQVESATMKRCNSLRNSMKRSNKVSGCLPRKTFSMRSTKSRVKDANSNPNLKSSRLSLKDSVLSLDVYGVSPNANDDTVTRRQKHKSFLKKLLTFRRSRRGSQQCSTPDPVDPTIETQDDNVNGKTSAMLTMSMSTQTSNSVENLPSSLGLLSIANPNCNSSSTKSPEPLDSDSGRYTESSASSASPHQSEVDIEISNVTHDDDNMIAMTRSNTPSPHEHGGLGSLLNTSDKMSRPIQSRRGQHPSPLSYESSSPSPSYRSGSGSKWTSPTLSPNLQSRCTSSASSSISSYHELYNKYRRKNPSYQQQFQHNGNHRQCHTLGSTGYVTPPPPSKSSPSPTKPSSSPFRYPPRPFEKKQIFKEMSQRSSQNKVDFDLDGRTSKSTTINDSTKLQGRDSSSSTSTTTTTTVTQTLKNSMNLELELLFPLGKLISAALTDFEQKSDPKEPVKKEPKAVDGDSISSKPSSANVAYTGMIINNKTTEEGKQVQEICKNLPSPNPANSNTNAANANDDTKTNIKTNTNDGSSLGQNAERDKVISEAHTTTSTTTTTTTTSVNDLFTINCQSFIKTNLHNDGLTSSTMEFKRMDGPEQVSKTHTICLNNVNSIKNLTKKNSNNKSVGPERVKGTYFHVIEPVSFKPFSYSNFETFESQDCRESEII